MNQNKKKNQNVTYTLSYIRHHEVIIAIEDEKISIQFINKPILEKITQHLNHHPSLR